MADRGLDGSPESDETVDVTVYLEDIESTGESAFEIKRKVRSCVHARNFQLIPRSKRREAKNRTQL